MKNDYEEYIIKSKLCTIQTPEYDIYGEVHRHLKGKNATRNSKKSLKMAVAIGISLLLSTGVLAVTISSFNKIESKVSPEIVPMLQPIESASEDNGIKMEVAAAYNDDEMVVVYLTLQDLTQDRLSHDTNLYDYSLSEGALFNSQIIDYDDETKTATFRIQANGGENIDGKELVFSLKSLLANSIVFDGVETGIELKDIPRESPETIELDMEHVQGGSGRMFDLWEEKGNIQVLKDIQRNIKLPDIEFMHISNIGYIDDKFHIQTKWTGEGIDDHGYFYFTDSNGTDLQVLPSTVHFGIDGSGNTMGRGDYIEYVFDLGETNLEDIDMKGYFVSSGKQIKGDWKVEFRLKSVGQEKKTSCDLDFGTWRLNHLYVSEIGVTLLGTGKYDDSQLPKIFINMSDGTIHEMTLVSSFTNNEKIYLKALTDQPIDTTMIESISINGNIVKPE